MFKKYLKIDINEIPGRLEMCKDIVSVYILIYQLTEHFIPCCTRSIGGVNALTVTNKILRKTIYVSLSGKALLNVEYQYVA